MLEELEAILVIIKVMYITYLVYEMYELLNSSTRRWWVRPVNLTREQEGFFNTCLQQLQCMDEEHFFKATRMSVDKFKLLNTLLKEKLQKHSQRKPISPEIRLAVTILYLAHGCSFQFLAWSHKIGISTVREIVYDTCQAIWDELHEIYLAPPKENDWQHISEQFYTKTGMPHCLGAIDGKHINIVKPAQSGSLFYNYKKTFSVVLLAACDSNFIFTLVDVGALGSQSDGGVFARSAFGKKILNNNLLGPKPKFLPGTETMFPFYFVGDNAFPLKPNLMRPFPGKNIPLDRSNFNKTLSRARVCIEIAFGILANRWGVLHTTIPASPKNVDKIVLATVVLHNFLMLQKDCNYYSSEDLLETGNRMSSATDVFFNRSSNEAFQLRDTLKSYLSNWE